MHMIEFRHHLTFDELEELVDLEIIVWQMGDGRGAVPTHILHSIAHAGGCVIGAFDDQQLIGFTLGFPGSSDGAWRIWSHMAGVHPAYQGRNIGFRLKQQQRTWALAHGYERISWTFDPMQHRNARFNLHKLGATAQVYHLDFYGEMTDGLNAGMRSDRLEVDWWLNDPEVIAIAEGRHAADYRMIDREPVFLLTGALQMPSLDALDAPCYAVEIPHDINQLKQQDLARARDWQLALREILPHAFAQGYVIVNLVTQDDQCWYLLSRNGIAR